MTRITSSLLSLPLLALTLAMCALACDAKHALGPRSTAKRDFEPPKNGAANTDLSGTTSAPGPAAETSSLPPTVIDQGQSDATPTPGDPQADDVATKVAPAAARIELASP